MQYIFAYDWLPWGGATALSLTLLESSRRADVKSLLTCNAVTYRFRDIHSQMAQIDVWEAKNGQPEALTDPTFENP